MSNNVIAETLKSYVSTHWVDWFTAAFVVLGVIGNNIETIAQYLPEKLTDFLILAVVFGRLYANSASGKKAKAALEQGQEAGDQIKTGITQTKAAKAALAAGRKILPLFLAAALLPILSGCAWVNTHEAQLKATGAVVAQRAAAVAADTLLSYAVNHADSRSKSVNLDGIALALQQHQTELVNASDIARLVEIWAPNDGARWKALAAGVGTVAADALQDAGQPDAATVIQNISLGLSQAAQNAVAP